MSKHEAFAPGPTVPKAVLSLGLYRTGSHSLKEALTILGYKNVFHSADLVHKPEQFPFFTQACDDNIPSLPGYTGRTYTREDWDSCLGACEALTDLTPFAEGLVEAYPEAKVILVKRDFESWRKSFLETLVVPSSSGLLAWMSGNVWEPVLGMKISQTVWRMYMGLMEVSRLDKVKDTRVLRAGYERYHRKIKRLVPPEKLLELDLKDLDWEPLCKFLGKEVPSQPFPRLNESKVFRNEFQSLHVKAMLGGLAKVGVWTMLVGAVSWGSLYLSRRSSLLA